MKRFGLLFLLSASYAGLLTCVFSTDYSRENSFLISDEATVATARSFEAPIMADFSPLANHADRFAHSQLPDQAPTDLHHEQSPESAGDR